jgi:subtilase family serine protease
LFAQGIEDYTTEVVSQNNKGGGITSGGGFSTYYPQPHWQNAATTEYFRQVSGTTILLALDLIILPFLEVIY